MSLEQIILSLNTAGTLAIGSISFFIVYTTFRGLEDNKIQEFSKRFLLAISTLILYVSYLMMYNSFFPESTIARYPQYLILIAVFLTMIYTAMGFEEIAEKYGISQDTKLDRMEEEELG